MSASIGIYPGGPSALGRPASDPSKSSTLVSVRDRVERNGEALKRRAGKVRRLKMGAAVGLTVVVALALGIFVGRSAPLAGPTDGNAVGESVQGDRLDQEIEHILKELWRMELVERGR